MSIPSTTAAGPASDPSSRAVARGPLESPLATFHLACWIVLVGSLAFVSSAQLMRSYWYPSFGRMDRHDYGLSGPLWLVPAADLAYSVPLLLIVLLGALAVSRRAVARRIWLRLSVGGVSFLTVLGLLVLVPRVHPYARILLALGIAVQVTRWVHAHQLGMRSLQNRTTFFFLLLASGLALGTPLWQRTSERRETAALPPADPEAANVLLITLDTVRAESMTLHGYHRVTTPSLMHFAQSGAVFERAIATSSWTLPTHASLFNGRLPHENTAGFVTPLDDRFPSLTDVLRDRGYLTAGFVANYQYCDRRTGLDRGMIHYDGMPAWPPLRDWRTSLGRVLSVAFAFPIPGGQWAENAVDTVNSLIPDKKPAAQISSEFLAWLADQGDRPFFCFLNYYDAHHPYHIAPPAFYEKFQGPGGRRTERDKYEACIAYLDDELRKLFLELEKRGVLDDTIIVVTSDHGEHFGEHDLTGHGNSLYSQLLHVPLVIRYPARVPADLRIDRAVSLRHVPTTVLDLLDLPAAEIPGTSLVETWSAEVEAPPGEAGWILSELHTAIRNPEWPNAEAPMVSVWGQGFHYIHSYGQQPDQVFDVRVDPFEEHDLAGTAEGEEMIEQFRGYLQDAVPADIADRLTEQ